MPSTHREQKQENTARETVIVVGGGAAGLMAAYFASIGPQKPRVILLEKNDRLGAKIIISGGGRCNLTTGLNDPREVLKNYPRGSRFLRTAIYNFPPQSVMDWFESQGVKLKIESDQRVFPVSNDGHQIVKALEKALLDNAVEIRLNCPVKKIAATAAGFLITVNNTTTAENENTLKADKIILTTGGNAYRNTGSSGDGYAFAEQLGHHLSPLSPSLSSLETKDLWMHQLSGVSFSDAELQLTCAGEKHLRRGPLLLTHRGLSGPAVFALSALAAYDQFSPEKPARLTINFFPDLSGERLAADLDTQINLHPNKKTAGLLAHYLPHALAEKIVGEKLAPVFPEKDFSTLTAANFPKALRHKIIENLTALPLEVIGRGAGDEFVTAGGVKLEEVNPSTMESRLRRGLYFAGELLDIDGFTGGFNLQASWASGALAGESAAASD